MIHVKHVYKGFEDTPIFEDFNYVFEECKYYVLFGPSGCGKTTLLNMLAHIWKVDKGEILYNGETTLQQPIAYITQDCYFVDYLNVQDNLTLCCKEEATIRSRLEEFGLSDCLHRYPQTLSGGEKQRLALVRALLLGCTTLLLDEPTAALDEKNSQLMFTLLGKLKDKYLIICVSHDERAKVNCDAWIDFTNLEAYKEEPIIDVEANNTIVLTSLIKPNLFSFIKQQNSYYKENKRVSCFLVILFTLVMFLFCVFTNPEKKLIMSLGNENHVNALHVTCNLAIQQECMDRKEDTGIKEVVYPYASAAMYYEEIVERVGESVSVNVDYEDTFTAVTLPKNKDLFYLANHIAYGSYPTSAMEVMVGNDLANQLAYQAGIDSEKLIGKNIQIITAHGNETFILVGIFDVFTVKENTYLTTVGSQANTANRAYFFHTAYARTYYDDDKLSIEEKNETRSFQYYFEDFEAVLEYESKGKDGVIVYKTLDYFQGTLEQFQAYALILMPMLGFILFLTILFYVFIRSVQMKYAKYIYSVYELCGYSIKEIKKATLLFYLWHLSKLYLIASMSSVLLGLLINQLNAIMSMFLFTPYAFDTSIIVLLYLMTLFVTIIFVQLHFHKQKYHSAYDMLRERRDLL